MVQELLLKCCIHSVVMSEVRGISECSFAVFLLAGTVAVFEVRMETSFLGRAGDSPAEKRVDYKRPREGRSMSHRAAAPHCRNQSMFVLCSLFLL